MEISDLMIGDLVLIDGKPVQVNMISDLGGINPEVSYGDKIWQYEFEPIPLTSEILEKNGFEKNEQDAIVITIRVYTLELGEKSIAIIEKPKGGYKSILGNVGEFSQQKMFFGDENFVCVSIHNVHELQHVLKLCKLNKEIIL